MFKTLAALRTSSVSRVAGVGVCGDSFRDLVNEATERLMIRGDWDGVVVPIHLCAKRGCVVFPRYVAEVRKMKVCGQYTPIENIWYEFLPESHSWCLDIGSWRSWAWWAGRMNARGQSPVFSDIMGDGRTIRAYLQANADIGKVTTFFGVDTNGQPLMRRDENGAWVDGVTVTLGKPYASTNVFVRHVDRILKEDTEKPVTYFAYNADQDVLEPLVTLDPTDSNPSFSRYQLQGGDCNCNCDQSIAALVKLRFIPVKAETDPVLIDNIAALKLMVQCIKAEDANDDALARVKESAAIRELNLALWNRDQEDQVAVSILPFGRTSIGRQQCF